MMKNTNHCVVFNKKQEIKNNLKHSSKTMKKWKLVLNYKPPRFAKNIVKELKNDENKKNEYI